MRHEADTDGCGGEHDPRGTTTVAALIPELLTRAQTGGCGGHHCWKCPSLEWG